MRKMYLLFIFMLILWLAASVFADVPRLVSYQGRITDTGGSPVTGGHNLTFKLYTVPGGGTAIFTETHPVTLDADGLYSVMLGSIVPFGSVVTFENQYWLGVSLDTDAEMGRYQFGASPYALNIADTIRKANTQYFKGSTGTAIFIDHAGGTGLAIYDAGNNGLDIESSNDDGIAVSEVGGDGIEVYNSVEHGINILDAGLDGIRMESPGQNGVYIDNAGDDGVVVYYPGDDGVQVQHPGRHGIIVDVAGYNGVTVYDPDSSGFYTIYPGRAGLEVSGGIDTKYGVYIHDATGSGDPDTGLVIRDTNFGVLVDNPGGTACILNGDLIVNGGFSTNAYSGSPFPIAYGRIDADGSIASGTGNFTCTLLMPDSTYEITITGETYTWDYVTVVTTLLGGGTTTPKTNAVGGKLQIKLVDYMAGRSSLDYFGFVVFKP